MFYTPLRPQGTISEAEGLSQLNFRIGFYTPLSDLRVPEVRPRDCLNSIFALCFTRLWATPGYHKWGRGIVSTQRLHCVLHAFEQPQGTISEAEGLSQLNFRIGSYTPLSDLRVPEVRPRDGLNSIFALGFTHLWATSGYQKWGQEIVSTQFPHWVLHAFDRPQGTRSEAEGLSQLNFRIVFYTPLSDLRVLKNRASSPWCAFGGSPFAPLSVLIASMLCCAAIVSVKHFGHFWVMVGWCGTQDARYLCSTAFALRDTLALPVAPGVILCDDMGVILCHPELLECSVCLDF